MRKYAIALLLVAAVIATSVSTGVLPAFGQTEPSPSATALPVPPASPPCSPLKQVYAESNWREAKPASGLTVCPAQDKAGARATVAHFYLYRRFREISPYRYGAGDKWLQWVPIPAAVVGCEGGTWDSHNPSGADGPAQLLGHGQPDVNSGSPPRTKVAYWEYTRDLYESSGLSPWSPSEGCWGGRV